MEVFSIRSSNDILWSIDWWYRINTWCSDLLRQKFRLMDVDYSHMVVSWTNRRVKVGVVNHNVCKTLFFRSALEGFHLKTSGVYSFLPLKESGFFMCCALNEGEWWYHQLHRNVVKRKEALVWSTITKRNVHAQKKIDIVQLAYLKASSVR